VSSLLTFSCNHQTVKPHRNARQEAGNEHN
jgi:hypothetical protein